MRFASGLLVVLLLLAGSCTHDQALPHAASPTPTGLPERAPVIIFSSWTSTVDHFTLTSPDGTVINRIDLDSTAQAQYQGDGTALMVYVVNHGLASPEVVESLTGSGAVHRIPDSLMSAFDWPAGGFGGDAMDGNPIFADDQTLVGVYGNRNGKAKYLLLDLNRAKEWTLLDVSSSVPTAFIPDDVLQPAGVSLDGRTGWAIVRHAKVGRTNVATWALAELDFAHRKLARLRAPHIPGLYCFNSCYPMVATVSPNGRFLAVQEASEPGISYPQSILATHLVDLALGRDSVLSAAPHGYGWPKVLRFSPDGTRLSVFGELTLPDGSRRCMIAVYDTADGTALWRREVWHSFCPNFAPAGWADGNHLVFTEWKGDRGTNPHSYIADVNTGSERELPPELGQPIAVLR